MANRPEPSDESTEAFLELVRAGVAPYDAARRVPGPVKRTDEEEATGDTRILERHESASRFRRMMKRGLLEVGTERQRRFAEAYIDALEEFDEEVDAQAEYEYLRRAFEPEYGGNGSSNRMLHQWVLTRARRRDSRLHTFMPLLEARTRHVHEGSVGHFPMLDVSKLSDEELEALQALLAKGGAAKGALSAPAPEQAALPAGAHPDIEA